MLNSLLFLGETASVLREARPADEAKVRTGGGVEPGERAWGERWSGDE